MHKLSQIAKCGCVATLIFQGLLLNKYLSDLHGASWWAWTIADIINIATWAFVLLYTQHRYKKHGIDSFSTRESLTSFPDEQQYAFIVWIFYIVLLCPRVIIMFYKHAPELDERNFFGPNFLKVALSCTPLIFLLMVCGFHNEKTGSKRKLYISTLTSTVTLDLFDSMDLLELLFEPENIPHPYLVATLLFACANMFLPTMALYGLHVNRYAGRVPSVSFKIAYSCSIMFLVNVPNLVIRSIIWHAFNTDVSVLIMKNVMCILIGLNEILEYVVEERPKLCDKCKSYFKPTYYDKHSNACQKPKAAQYSTFMLENEESESEKL